MENTFGRSPKFTLSGTFPQTTNLGTIDVLIELCPMVPFVAKVPHGVTVSTFAYEGWITLTVAEPSTLPVFL